MPRPLAPLPASTPGLLILGSPRGTEGARARASLDFPKSSEQNRRMVCSMEGVGGECQEAWGTHVMLRDAYRPTSPPSKPASLCTTSQTASPTTGMCDAAQGDGATGVRALGTHTHAYSLRCRHSQFPQTHAHPGPKKLLGAVTPQPPLRGALPFPFPFLVPPPPSGRGEA